MTVEKLFGNLSVASQPPPTTGVWPKENFEAPSVGAMTTARFHGHQPARHIDIPSRNRHQSWSSTGSVGSGKSSPLSVSPPVHDLFSLQLHGLTFPAVQVSTSPKSKLDRCLSTSSTESTQGHKNVNPTRYKTEMCRPFEENGQCKYGDKCQFAHGRHEVRNLSRHPKYKTELCRTYHTVGFCPYGPRCHFIHNEDELKLTEITHMKHRQMLQQVAQQVAQQQQVLSRMALSHPVQEAPKPMPMCPQMTYSRPGQAHGTNNLDFTHLSLPMSSLGSTIDSPPASVASSSPSLSPTSMMSDDVFSGVPTPPPGFAALPSAAAPPVVFSFAEATPAIQQTFCPRPSLAGTSSSLKREERPRSSSPDSDSHGYSCDQTLPNSPIRLPIFSQLVVNN